MRGTDWGQRKMGHNAQNLSTCRLLVCIRTDQLMVTVTRLMHSKMLTSDNNTVLL